MPSFNSSRPLKRRVELQTFTPEVSQLEASNGISSGVVEEIGEKIAYFESYCSDFIEKVNQAMQSVNSVQSFHSEPECKREEDGKTERDEKDEKTRKTLEEIVRSLALFRTELNALTRKVDRMSVSVEDLDKTTTRKKELEPLLSVTQKVSSTLAESVKKKHNPKVEVREV